MREAARGVPTVAVPRVPARRATVRSVKTLVALVLVAGVAFAATRLGAAQHRHETDLLAGIVAERAGEMRCHGQRAGFLNSAQRHAHVLGLDHHRNASRLEDLVDRGRHLRGQMLLRLQPQRIDVHQPCELR